MTSLALPRSILEPEAPPEAVKVGCLMCNSTPWRDVPPAHGTSNPACVAGRLNRRHDLKDGASSWPGSPATSMPTAVPVRMRLERTCGSDLAVVPMDERNALAYC